jgi:hypothetical protein
LIERRGASAVCDCLSLNVSISLQDLFHERKEDVGVQRALVRLVEHHDRVLREHAVGEALAQKDAVRQIPASARRQRRQRSGAAARGAGVGMKPHLTRVLSDEMSSKRIA